MLMNRRAHHTDKFSSQELIVRRGQPWEMILVGNRSLESGEDLNFIVSTGTHSTKLPLRDHWTLGYVLIQGNYGSMRLMVFKSRRM